MPGKIKSTPVLDSSYDAIELRLRDWRLNAVRRMEMQDTKLKEQEAEIKRLHVLLAKNGHKPPPSF